MHPGTIDIKGRSMLWVDPRASMLPRDEVGGWIPRPTKLSPASAITVKAKIRVS